MNSVVEFLAFFLPLLTISSVVFIFFLNLYLKIRRQFPIKVNCWFCNQWTKVPYDDYNSFVCPNCQQYNGFNEDGDYNRPLPEFTDELLNIHKTPFNKTKTASSGASNGLCQLCNNNQQLKVYQLANFVPLYEENFDVEIEHFEKQLEKAYKLCTQCEKTVNSTIHRQNTILGLNMTYLQKKGVFLFDFNRSHNDVDSQAKLLFFLRTFRWGLILFAILNFVTVTEDLLKHRNVITTVKKLLHYFHKFKEHFISAVESTESFQFITTRLSNFVKLPSNERLTQFFYSVSIYMPKGNKILLPTAGLLLQLLMLFWKNQRSSTTILQLFSWSTMLIIAVLRFRNIQVDGIKTAISVFLLVSYLFISGKDRVKSLKKKKQFKKLKKRKAETDNFSDCDDIDLTLNEKSSSPKQRSPGYNHSTAYKQPSVSSVYSKRSPDAAFFQRNTNHLFGNTAVFENPLNRTFTTTPPKEQISNSFTQSVHADKLSSVSYFNLNKPNHLINGDLKKSLDKLSLGNHTFDNKLPKTNAEFGGKLSSANLTFGANFLLGKSTFKDLKNDAVFAAYKVNMNVQRPKPIISPPKLHNPTQNSWAAGGFWRDMALSPEFFKSPSRSSNHSSGFFSQGSCIETKGYYSLPSSRNNSACCDFERCSVISEPIVQLSNRCTTNINNKSSDSQTKHCAKEWRTCTDRIGNSHEQLNISLQRKADPVLITEGVYRTTTPVTFACPQNVHLQQVYNKETSGFKHDNNDDLLYRNNGCNSFASGLEQGDVREKNLHFG